MEKVLIELKELRSALAKLIGTSELPISEQFSVEALDKASKQFQKLAIERGEWVRDTDISKYIKSANWRAGKFIINEFKFTNYFRKGQVLYFNKKTLVDLGAELKKRNVDLGRYIEYIEDKKRFDGYVEKAKDNRKEVKSKKPFQLKDELKDITTSPIPKPNAEVIKEDIKKLKEEFFQLNLIDYVDIYDKNYAMMKHIYHFQKYIKPELKKKCRKWCEDFNYANNALKEVTNRKETFMPVKEDDMIQL